MKTSIGKKKTKLPAIAVLTGIMAACMLLFVAIGGEWLTWMNMTLAIYFTLTAFFLWKAFRKQVREDLYSYNTIFTFGFALFILSLAGTYLYITVHGFLYPQSFREAQMVFTLLHSAKIYMLLTAPFLLIFAGSLMVSNIMLLRHEGFRFVNLLGILLAFFLIAGQGLIHFLDYRAAIYGQQKLPENLAVNLLAAFYLYFECMIVGAAVADLIAAKGQPQKDRDFLIVLGCAIRKDGTPTPLLRGRLDLALRFWKEQMVETGKEAFFVVSGGQGSDEVQSEAMAMKEYLADKGVSQDKIFLEDRSVNTLENMVFSKKIIDTVEPEAKTAFFTTNYHVFRSGLKARQAGLDSMGMGADTKWFFWPNAAVREFVGLLTEHRRKQAILMLVLVAAYTVLTGIAYSGILL